MLLELSKEELTDILQRVGMLRLSQEVMSMTRTSGEIIKLRLRTN